MEEFQVPGLAIAIIRDGRLLWRGGFGLRDVESKEPFDNETTSEIASVSKTVFAYAAMKLCEKGVIGLDSPLTKYTPERYVAGDPRLDLITARHVLTHTTGFQNWRTEQEPLRIHFTPGQRFSYSGEAFSYLQSVVTRLRGHVNPAQCDTYEAGLKVCATDIDASMRADLLTPFGMTSSGYVWNDTFAKHAARGHDPGGKPLPRRNARATDAARYAAAGGLYTTPTDFAKFMIEIINPKPGDAFRLKRESLKAMLRPHVKVNDTISQALGWHVLHTAKGDFIFHGGGNPGFSAFALASVERRAGVVMTTNSENGYKAIDRLLGGEILSRFLGTRLHYPLF